MPRGSFCQTTTNKISSTISSKRVSVAKCTIEFDHLMMKSNIVELEEQTIIQYISGLQVEVGNVVQLQPYWTIIKSLSKH